MGKMDCVKVAFREAGYDSNHLPDTGIKQEEMPHVCQQFGAQYHTGERLEIGEEPIIAVYQTTNGTGHAVYHHSPSDMVPGEKVIGVVTGIKR